MAEKSGFFNALRVDGNYDRKYNANDYSDNLAVVIGNGVLRSAGDDLRATAAGMLVTVAAGRAWINGHYYHNDAPLTFAAVTAPAGGTRWDRIMLRLDSDISARSIKLRYVQGTAANNPTKPEPVRNGSVYELVLADIYVGTNATSLIITDTRSNAELCGWVYSTSGDNSFFTTLDNDFKDWFTKTRDTVASVTLFKRYTWRTVLAAASTSVSFNIPQWNEETTFIEVYVNGVLDVEGADYTRSGTVLTFKNSLVANTEIVVLAYKSIDGTGIQSVADEITELQNAVAALNVSAEYNYVCNGVDDNVQLSALAKAWLESGGNDDYSSKTIRVYGTLGAKAAVSGNGSTASPFRWFEIDSTAAKNRRLLLDFSNCSGINLTPSAGTVNHIFAGKNVRIFGAVVRAFTMSMDTVVRVFSNTDGATYAEQCYFNIYAARDSVIGSTGTFVNCRGVVTNLDADSFCFNPQGNSLLRVIGGEYTSYTGYTSAKSAVVGQSAAGAVSILDGVNAPTIAYSGSYQTHAIYQAAGAGYMNCRDLVTKLPVSTVSGISNVQGTIPLSKAGSM